jgi:hypothetical protein
LEVTLQEARQGGARTSAIARAVRLRWQRIASVVHEPCQELVEAYVRLAKKARSLLEVPHGRTQEELLCGA